jgi:hypothetical protein
VYKKENINPMDKPVPSDESPTGDDKSAHDKHRDFVLEMMQIRGSTHVLPDPQAFEEMQDMLSRYG